MKAGRPPAGNVPLNTIVGCKLSEAENKEFEEVVRLANVSKSEIVRIMISSLVKYVKKGVVESNKEVIKLLQQRRFSMEALQAIVARQEQEMNRELNAFVYQLNAKNAKAKQKKKEKTDSPSEQ